MAKSTPTLAYRVHNLYPCSDAIEWLKQYNLDESERAWKECPRGDWMLWLIGKQCRPNAWSAERQKLLACCLDCAELAKHLWPAREYKKIAKAAQSLRNWIAGLTKDEKLVKEAKKAIDELFSALTLTSNFVYSTFYISQSAVNSINAVYSILSAAQTADSTNCNAIAEYATNVITRIVPIVQDGALPLKVLAKCAHIVRQHYSGPPNL